MHKNRNTIKEDGSTRIKWMDKFERKIAQKGLEEPRQQHNNLETAEQKVELPTYPCNREEIEVTRLKHELQNVRKGFYPQVESPTLIYDQDATLPCLYL